MKNTDKAIIKIGREEVYDIDPMIYGIKYLSDKIDIYKTMDAILDTRETLTEDDLLLNYAKGREQEIYNLLIDNTGQEDKENFNTLQDFIDYDGAKELLNFIIETREDIEELCTANKCNFGTVGYSDWAYYVAIEETEYNFINDLWEGWNWYVLQIIEDNDIVDSVSEVYIEDTEALDMAVYEIFGLDREDYLIVDSEVTTYFNKDKIQEIEHCSYEYVIQ